MEDVQSVEEVQYVMFYLFLPSALQEALKSERILWTKTRSSDWWEWRGDPQAVLATLLTSAHIPEPPLMIGVANVFSEYYQISSSHVNEIVCPSCDT